MSFKEEVNKEKSEIVQNKKPYETASFIVFAVLFFQQIAILVYRMIEFFASNAGTPWFSLNAMTTPAFFNRIVGIDCSKVIFLIIGLIALVFYYYLIYVLVFRYCSRHGLAKWTWTLIVVFAPTIFFIPPYVFYAVYVFRPYFFRFIKKGVSEYKEFNKDTVFTEEKEEKEEKEEQ
jgi:uncharacterized membrane-anchored protein